MKIGYLYDFKAYPPKGGNHVHAMELTQGFLRHGHSVSVVDDPTMPGVINFSSDQDQLNDFIASIDILYIRIDARQTRLWKVMNQCTPLVGNRPIVWEINSPANEALAYSWLGGRALDYKESRLRRLRRWLHAFRKKPAIWLEERHRRRLAKHVTAAICVSRALASYAEKELKIPNVQVLPNGGPLLTEAEINQRSARRTRSEFTVLYSGSAMYPWQGLDYLTQTIKLARQKAPDILFVLAVNQRTPDLPTSENVIVLEHLDRDQILDAICAADVCVSLHPEYPWSKYNFHNSPMKLFEYMACMRPSVASNHGQMNDLIHDGVDGLLCKNEPEDILQKLLFLKDNPDLAKNMGRQAWLRIQNELNWENNIIKTISRFEQCVALK